MELRNLVWNELCATAGRTTIKMNAYFVPRFSFICLQAANTQNTGFQGSLGGPYACSTSKFSLSGFLRDGYKRYPEIERV